MNPNLSYTRQTHHSTFKPVMLVVCLVAAGLLAHGVVEQSAATIETRHTGGRTNPWRGLAGCMPTRRGSHR